MRPPECTFLLANGHKCRAAATRGRSFCRHHDPSAQTAPAGRRISKRDLYSRLRRWSGLSRDLPSLPLEEIPCEAFAILHALLAEGEESISDRVAGRLLRGLFRRLGAVPFPPPPPPYAGSAPQPPTGGALQPDLMEMLVALGSLAGVPPDPDFPATLPLASPAPRSVPQPILPQPRPTLTQSQPRPHQSQPALMSSEPALR